MHASIHDRDAKTLCTLSGDNEKPEINLHKVMDEISKRRGVRWDNNVKEEGEWNTVLVRLEKRKFKRLVASTMGNLHVYTVIKCCLVVTLVVSYIKHCGVYTQLHKYNTCIHTV